MGSSTAQRGASAAKGLIAAILPTQDAKAEYLPARYRSASYRRLLPLVCRVDPAELFAVRTRSHRGFRRINIDRFEADPVATRNRHRRAGDFSSLYLPLFLPRTEIARAIRISRWKLQLHSCILHKLYGDDRVTYYRRPYAKYFQTGMCGYVSRNDQRDGSTPIRAARRK